MKGSVVLASLRVTNLPLIYAAIKATPSMSPNSAVSTLLIMREKMLFAFIV
nr:MAG TPA: hypothetical protein [Caudoviricetes sp.]